MRYLAPIGAAAIIIYLVMKPGPVFYSYNEMARATASCGADKSHGCLVTSLENWRKIAPDDAPRGSR